MGQKFGVQGEKPLGVSRAEPPWWKLTMCQTSYNLHLFYCSPYFSSFSFLCPLPFVFILSFFPGNGDDAAPEIDTQ